MITFINSVFNATEFNEADLFVCAIGYESRSYYLYSQIATKFSKENVIIFVFDDYKKYDHTRVKVEEINSKGYKLSIVNYQDYQTVQQQIFNLVEQKILKSDSITVHIDYSSMPRSWYCKIPILFQKILRKQDRACFWYSEGEYPERYEEYPSAGIDSFSLFSGKPSLQIDKKRVHIIALSYDVVRTQAIISIVDPDYFVACEAHNPSYKKVHENVLKANEQLLARAAMSLSLHLNDFSFMVSKLRETANEFLAIGDVIFLPDGPKPLIFATSLVPDLLNKDGITCLHISRNNNYFKPINVAATGTVLGFSVHIE